MFLIRRQRTHRTALDAMKSFTTEMVCKKKKKNIEFLDSKVLMKVSNLTWLRWDDGVSQNLNTIF